MKASNSVSGFFETGKRTSGEEFTSLKDERPEWLHDAIREAHAGDLPNDWIYQECRAACEAFDAGDLTSSDDDSVQTHADSRVDVYTRHLYQWAADFCLSSTWANAECEANELGAGDVSETEKRLAMVQYCARATIARIMVEACETNRETEESEAAGA